MRDSILVSVVIPVHNEEAWIASCIESFLGQTYKNIEIIVVDDGSTDRSVEIASRYPVFNIRHKECLGEAQARTTGTKAARGEIILHGEADAVYPPDYIQKALVCFQNSQIMAVSCGEIKVFPSLQGIIAEYCRVRREASYILRVKGRKPNFGCHFVRREVFDQIGFYDPSCTTGCDADLALRILKARMQIEYVPDLYFYHADPSTLSSFIRRVFRGSLTQRQYLERWGGWLRGWRKVVFLIWNGFITLIPVFLGLGLLHWEFALLALGGILIESIGPLLVHEESRKTWQLALKHNKLLAILMPGILFIRFRAVSFGRLIAMLCPKVVRKIVTYD